ncbi:MAG: hypothetical protein Q7T97_02435 [Burkholderiaceae bacterium]|nr:hypothetical protein [Burkholderiaceae bacterium]
MKMDETQLLAFLEAEQSASYHYVSGQLSRDRQQALRDYNRLPYGNEEDGRSQAIASDVFDVVEGMLPDLLEVFVSTDKAVVFDAVGPEDEESASQITDACNYVFYKSNNGFLILYSAIKSALMLKTGAVEWWWDKSRQVDFQSYTTDEMQLAMFMQGNPDAVIVETEELPPDPQAQPEEMGLMPKRLRVKIKTIKERNQVKLAAIPADELHVSARHASILLDDAPYVAHVCERTLSDIMQLGYDVTVDDVKAAADESTTQDRELRQELRGGKFGWWDDQNAHDDAMSYGWLRKEYVLVDFDGDGIAERRRIVRLGKKILENVEVSHVPFAAWSPYLNLHQFVGMCPADLIGDVQRISTDILRQQIDNLALANNQETIVLTDAQGNPKADLDDLLNRRVGGILRESVQGAIRPMQERWQGIEAMPFIEQLANMREARTGYSRFSPGLDGEGVSKTATEVSKVKSEQQKRQKLMGRICAEALVAPMFRGIFKTLSDYCMDKLTFRLNGKPVSYDPQEWRDQYDLTINVGIGNGDDMQQGLMLQQIAGAQMAIMQTPMAGRLVTEANIYEAQAAIAEKAGFKNAGRFWSDPKNLPPPQPPQVPPDPMIIKTQMELQADAQKFQAETQLRMQEIQMQSQAKLQEVQANLELQAANDQRDSERESMKAQLDAQIAAAEQENKRMLADLDASVAKYKADLDSQTKLTIAQMGNQQSMELASMQSQTQASPAIDIGPIQDALAQLMDHASAPVEIIRGPDGRAAGIRKGNVTKSINRGPDGRAQGIM